MNTQVRRVIIATFILLTACISSPGAEEPSFFWFVAADGQEGTLEISSGPGGQITGTLLGRPIQGWLVARHLVLSRQGSEGLESWEACIAPVVEGQDESPLLAGTFVRPGGEGPLPWLGVGHKINFHDTQEGPPAQAGLPQKAPVKAPPVFPPKPSPAPVPSVTPRLENGQPSLEGTWMTPDGPLNIRQNGSRLIFELPDREVSGRLTGPDSLIGGFGPGCCKGQLEQAFTVIAWDNGIHWYRK